MFVHSTGLRSTPSEYRHLSLFGRNGVGGDGTFAGLGGDGTIALSDGGIAAPAISTALRGRHGLV